MAYEQEIKYRLFDTTINQIREGYFSNTIFDNIYNATFDIINNTDVSLKLRVLYKILEIMYLDFIQIHVISGDILTEKQLYELWILHIKSKL